MNVLYRQRFGFGELSFELVTDWLELSTHWRKYTSYFHTDCEPAVEYVVNRGPIPAIEPSDSERIELSREIDLYFRLEELFLKDLVRKMAERYMVYSAAVTAHNGLATVYLSEPGAGKSMLCVDQVRAGATYLSDCVAAVDEGEVIALPRPISFNNIKQSLKLVPKNDPLFEPLSYSFADNDGRMRLARHLLPSPNLTAPAGTRFIVENIVYLEKVDGEPPIHFPLNGAEKRARLASCRLTN